MNPRKDHQPIEEPVPGWRTRASARMPAQPSVIEVADPATGGVLATVSGGGRTEAVHAVDAAADALPQWSSRRPPERAHALRQAADALRLAVEELAPLITLETGKRLAESRAEVGLSADFLEWFADAAATSASREWNVRPGITHHVDEQPLGVVAVLTPWNFPLSIPVRKLAAALAAGCTTVFKPSEVAPLSGLRLAEILEAVVPPGTVETVAGPAAEIADTWIADRRVRGLTFTGSTRVGQIIAAQGAGRFLRTVLELGGSAPFIVLPDADLAAAAECLMVAKFRNNGQSCIAANTAWVPRDRMDEFVAYLTGAIEALVVGDPLDERTGLGPTCLPSDPARLAGLAEDARGSGAKIISPGGPRDHDGGFFAEPVVCVEPGDARVMREEIFGPVLPVASYDDLDAVIGRANDSPLGLAGYVCGTDVAAARQVASRLDVGIVGINTAAANTPQIPFAPRRDSGLGTEGSRAGLEEFVARQSVAVAPPG